VGNFLGNGNFPARQALDDFKAPQGFIGVQLLSGEFCQVAVQHFGITRGGQSGKGNVIPHIKGGIVHQPHIGNFDGILHQFFAQNGEFTQAGGNVLGQNHAVDFKGAFGRIDNASPLHIERGQAGGGYFVYYLIEKR